MANSPSQPRPFSSTRWSLVLRARGNGPEATRALAELCKTYWFPLYAWCRRSGHSPADAEDFVQGFFVEILEKNLFARADVAVGKLRTFLLTALGRFIRDQQSKAGALRRGGGRVVSFDAVEAESWFAGNVIDGEDAARLYDRQWAVTVVENAMRALERYSVERGRADLFRALKPFLATDGGGAEYQSAAARLGMSPESFKVAVHRHRARFRELLRAEVADTQPDGADVDAEMDYLRALLGG